MLQTNGSSRRRLMATLAAMLLLLVTPVLVANSDRSRESGRPIVRIGVLANCGVEQCHRWWAKSIDYLNSAINGYTFKLVPLEYGQILPSVENGAVDFMLTNPSFYVIMERLHGANRIATLKTRVLNNVCTTFGGVIFTRADRDDIHGFADLKGKSFMAVEEMALGGWQTAWRELKKRGIDPRADFTDLKFGGTNDVVVYAVRDGKVDAGSVRTDTLERMAAGGKIRMEDFRVFVHDHTGRRACCYPFKHSTDTYPEWPMAKLKQTPDHLAEKVAVALIGMPLDKAARCAGWTIPHNYQLVHECLKELRIQPYENYGKLTFAQFMKEYLVWVITGLVVFVVFCSLLVVIFRFNAKLQLDIINRKQAEEELHAAHVEVESLLASITSIMIRLDNDNLITLWNHTAEIVFGINAGDALGQTLQKLKIGGDWEEMDKKIKLCREKGTEIRIDELTLESPNGSEYILAVKINLVVESSGQVVGVLVSGADISERKGLERQLNQSQKLESIGQLAAGIAHEINTPVQYVDDNTRFLQESFVSIEGVLRESRDFLVSAAQHGVPPEIAKPVQEAFEQADVDYLLEEIPRAIEQTLEGVSRVTRIVRAMKSFSHPGIEAKAAEDLNKLIENTATVCRNEWKYVADVKMNLDENLPTVHCLSGELNQVILNLIINAAHAIQEVQGESSEHKGTITLETKLDGEWVEVRIGDTGGGIPKAIASKVFDLFFTTKEAGRGTGQGLSIARDVIVNKHDGSIDFTTQAGEGTTFIIRLPIRPPKVRKGNGAKEVSNAA